MGMRAQMSREWHPSSREAADADAAYLLVSQVLGVLLPDHGLYTSGQIGKTGYKHTLHKSINACLTSREAITPHQKNLC